MYLIIRRLKVHTHFLDEAIQRIENGYVPILQSHPGFIEFYAVKVGEDEGVSISVFETRQAAEEANRQALDWAKENLAVLAQGPAEIVAAGEVQIHKRATN
jgi:heme-degrading monooxygenase HmoA